MTDRKQIAAKRFFGLDFLRVLAVSMILFSHLSWIYNSNGLLGKLQDMSGFLGIELFIVLSGFLIGGLLYKQFLQDEYTLKDGSLFIYRRLVRLLPSYYLVILLNCAGFLAFGLSVAGVWKYFLLMQNFASPVSPFFPESWSLPVKEIGYILAVTLLLVLSNTLVRTSKRLLFLMVVIGLIFLTLLLKIAYNINSTNSDLIQWSFNVRSVVIYRMDSVLIGVLAGYFYHNHKGFIQSKGVQFLIVGFLLFLFLLLFITVFGFTLKRASWFWNVLCLPVVSLAICMFIPLLLQMKSPSEIVENLVGFICKISYSIYLLHYSFILFLLKNLIDTHNYTTWQLNIFTLFYLLTTVGLSYLLYAYIEKPINQYRTKNLKLNGKQ